MKKIVILGGGDLAQKTVEIIRRDKLFKIIGFYNNVRTFKDIKFLGTFSKFYSQKRKPKKTSFVLALGGRPELLTLRKKIINILVKKKINTPKVLSKLATIHKKAKIEDGAIIFDNVTIDYKSSIGSFAIVNIGTIVCHDSFIGKNTILSPKTLVLGRCILRGDIFIGSGSIINPKIVIEKNVIIGSMSNVLKNIKKKGTYLGNPSRKLID
jgi:sugar O-acyltransferase (sialic acid O-acetyltransferase NeuD family)